MNASCNRHDELFGIQGIQRQQLPLSSTSSSEPSSPANSQMISQLAPLLHQERWPLTKSTSLANFNGELCDRNQSSMWFSPPTLSPAYSMNMRKSDEQITGNGIRRSMSRTILRSPLTPLPDILLKSIEMVNYETVKKPQQLFAEPSSNVKSVNCCKSHSNLNSKVYTPKVGKNPDRTIEECMRKCRLQSEPISKAVWNRHSTEESSVRACCRKDLSSVFGKDNQLKPEMAGM